MTIKPVYPPSGSVNKCHAYNHVPVPGRPPNVTYVCRACVCVCRSPSPFSACVHHPSVRTLAYTYHLSRLGACVCVCRSPSPFSACVHHPSVRTLAYTYHLSHRFSACVHRSPVHAYTYAGRPPRLRARIICVYQLRVSLSVHAHIIRACLCTCVHRPCAVIASQRVCAQSSACVCVTQCSFKVFSRSGAHATARTPPSEAAFDDQGSSPECVSPTPHDAYIPRRRIPSRLQASATNPEDYVTDHQIWLGLLLVCDGRHCFFPSSCLLARPHSCGCMLQPRIPAIISPTTKYGLVSWEARGDEPHRRLGQLLLHHIFPRRDNTWRVDPRSVGHHKPRIASAR